MELLSKNSDMTLVINWRQQDSKYRPIVSNHRSTFKASYITLCSSSTVLLSVIGPLTLFGQDYLAEAGLQPFSSSVDLPEASFDIKNYGEYEQYPIVPDRWIWNVLVAQDLYAFTGMLRIIHDVYPIDPSVDLLMKIARLAKHFGMRNCPRMRAFFSKILREWDEIMETGNWKKARQLGEEALHVPMIIIAKAFDFKGIIKKTLISLIRNQRFPPLFTIPSSTATVVTVNKGDVVFGPSSHGSINAHLKYLTREFARSTYLFAATSTAREEAITKIRFSYNYMLADYQSLGKPGQARCKHKHSGSQEKIQQERLICDMAQLISIGRAKLEHGLDLSSPSFWRKSLDGILFDLVELSINTSASTCPPAPRHNDEHPECIWYLRIQEVVRSVLEEESLLRNCPSEVKKLWEQ